MTILGNIISWNKERNLLERGFNHKKEVSFIVEELLESTGNYVSETARPVAETMAETIVGSSNPSEEILIDSLADIIVYTTGAIGKLGYDPDLVMKEVYKEISSRTGKIIDGKFVKDPDAKIYKADFSKCKLDTPR